MASILRRMIPRSIVPTARIAYRKLRGKPTSDIFTAATYRALQALKCSIAYNEYGGYCVPESSRALPAAAAVLENKVWEPETLRFIRKHCTGDIVHAGTFFGDFLPAISPKASAVWAFEPNAENYRCAKITVELNGLSNVHLSHAGLGAARETLRMRTKDAQGNSLGGCSAIDQAGDEAIEILRIDDVVPHDRNVSMIQLDVEGHEESALMGAIETVKRCKPVLILEVAVTSLSSSEWFRRNILDAGYHEIGALHDNAIFRCR